MSNVMRATIEDEPLDPEALRALVAGSDVGGCVVFVGAVRDHDGAKAVNSLSYSAHPTAEALIQASADRVSAEYSGVRLAVTHRVGDLTVGDLAVVVAAGAAHRDRAFAAARMLIDDVKTTVPIWKHQLFEDGSDEWVGLP